MLLQQVGADNRRWELSARAVIGRDASCEVQVDDPLVSLRHAELVPVPGGRWELRDLGSRRGTFRGGKRVQTAVLEHGDEVLVGPALLRFEDGARAANSDPHPEPGGISLRRPVTEPTFPPADSFATADELRRDYEKLRAAMELFRVVGVGHDLPTLLDRVLQAAFSVLQAERGAVMLLDQAGEPFLQISRDRRGKHLDLPLPTAVMREALRVREGVVAVDAGIDVRFSRSASISTQGVRSAMCVPMVYRDELIGLMHLDSLSAAGAFTARDLELFTVVTTQAAAAVKNATLVQRMQAVVAEDRQRLERLVSDLPVGVVVLGEGKRVALANPRAQQLLPELATNAPGADLGGVAAAALEAAVQASGRPAVDLTVPGPERRVLAVSASTSHNKAGGEETVVVLRDVTEEREAEAKSAQQDRLALIGQLAGGVAHDFNNLLAVVANYASFIESESTDAAVQSDARQIVEAASRAAGLTRQLLAFGRREMIKPRVIELGRVVRGFEDLLRRTLGEHLRLETSYSDGLLRVRADPAKIEQVLINLAVNARDAMAAGGTLSIKTGFCRLDESAARREAVKPGDYVQLSVSDTGTGMSPEVAARVFEPFFTTKQKGKGTGLGLATVYGIVQQAQGNVSVESHVGKGTTFRVLLPATEDPADRSDPGVRAAPGGQETVLLAEDEDGVRELTRRVLAQAGYKVLVAASGEEALERARAHVGPLHLLVTDVVMPGISGKKLAQSLSELRTGVKVLFMSGYFDDGVALGDRVPFLPKPFTREELLARVRAVLAPAG